MCLLVIINHFPIYMFFGYFFEPGIFVKSMYFEIIQQPQNSEFPTNYLLMCTQKHPFMSLFSDFFTKIKYQVLELVNISVLKHIVIGTKIPRTNNCDYLTNR